MLSNWPAFLHGDHGGWPRFIAVIVVAIALGLVVHAALDMVAQRLIKRERTPVLRLFVDRLRQPTRWLLIAVALSLAVPAMHLGEAAAGYWRFAAGLIMPALIGWLAVATLAAFKDMVDYRADISVTDNLRARQKRTRAGILYRIALMLVLLITIFLMLMTIPAVRSIGVTLAASAGIGALVVGAAAQPALKNLIAGVQMAFTEPIRLDDVVIVDGEWGRVEEIRLTYVVVAIWDQRRLVVPVSKFLEESFQNWTRSSSELLGTVFVHVDRTADVSRIRAKFEEITKAEPKWDGRVCGLQVTDSFPTYMELRCLVSARNSGDTFDLRCAVREKLTAFIGAEMPEALPRDREQILLQPSPGSSPETVEEDGRPSSLWGRGRSSASG